MNHIREQLLACANAKERKLLLKDIRKYIQNENKQYPLNKFIEIPVPAHLQKKVTKIYRSKEYLAQVYQDATAIRISVNKTEINDEGDWLDGISWDALMWIKREIGFADHHAVEVYPKDENIINVANIRHLFILKEPLDFIW